MIYAEKVSKKFGDFMALQPTSCSIPNGCIYGMVGSNGAGKSTFLRLMAGVYKSDSGTLLVEGVPVFENSEAKSRIIFIADDLYFLPGANMERMADFYRHIYPRFDLGQYRYLADAFRLPREKALSQFSKGMRRQAAIILGICAKPDYLLLDETFDGLDPIMRSLVKKLICQDVMERNSTAIITSHSLRELEDTCDQLAFLHQGGVILESDVQNLKTSLFKVQIAFRQPYDRELFENMDILHFVRHGSVTNMIVKGDREETISRLQQLSPLLLDILPLTLEEVFTYEMEALGYSFGDVLEVGE